MRLMSFTESKARSFVALIYGQPGCGKSTLAISSVLVPELRPVLVVDYRGNTEQVVVSGLRRKSGVWKEIADVENLEKNLYLVGVSGPSDLLRLVSELKAKGHVTIDGVKIAPKTFVVDVFSDIQQAYATGLARNENAKTNDGLGLSQRAWGAVKLFTEGLLATFEAIQKQYGITVLLTAWERATKDSDTVYAALPDLAGQGGRSVMGAVAAVIWMTWQEVRGRKIPVAYATETAGRLGKNAFNLTGKEAIFPNPTMKKIMEAFYGTG